MDYLKLSVEIKKNSDYIKNQISIVYNLYINFIFIQLTKISFFFKCLKEYGTKMIEKCKKALDDLNNEIHKDKIETSINYSLNDFIQTSKNFLTNLQKTFDKIGKDLNEKTDSKQDEFNKINLNFINELKQLETFLINSKNKLETSKYEYFDASKIRYEQEEKFNKFLDSQINQNIANNTFSQLIKAQKNCEKITQRNDK